LDAVGNTRSRGRVSEPFEEAISGLPAPAPGIELWWATLDAGPERLEACTACLSDTERARAERFGNRSLRVRYIIGRGTLRAVLGASLGIAPADVEIVRGARGRPRLRGETRLDFNLTHTSGVAVIGIAQGSRIGVDIERADRNVKVNGIARKFMTADERAALAPLDADAKRLRLLRLWTCKEAMSKATGDALSAPFASIDVALREQPVLARGPSPYDPDRWSLHALAVPQEYLATLAVWAPPKNSTHAR
jgi:Phosphopantetheinyl transferase